MRNGRSPRSQTCQRDESVRGPTLQVQGLIEQLQEADSSIHARHQRLQISAIEYWDPYLYVFQRAADQWRNELAELGMDFRHVLHDLCKRDKDDYGASSLADCN